MEISLLKSLLNSIACLFKLSSCANIRCEHVQKYHHDVEEILKLLKPIFEVIVDTEIASDDLLQKEFAGLRQSVNDLIEIFKNWEPLMSKVYFVMQVEALTVKIQNHALQSLELLKSYDQSLPAELNAVSLQYCVQKMKRPGSQISSIIMEAIRNHVQGSGASTEDLAKIADRLILKSNQELLVEAVALEKLKENAEQAEDNGEVEYIDQMIILVTHMHDLLVMMKQSEFCNPVSIPADFCCPLSLELMTDPVIVASGQTYERAFIRSWIDLGLTVCPKTRQPLAHTNLIPNYTVKALIANWCELNNVKLPDPTRSYNLNQPTSLLANAGSVGVRKLSYPDTTEQSLGSTQRHSTSPSHPSSFPEVSSTGAAVNGVILDMESVSQRRADEKSNRSVEGYNSSGVLYMSPSRIGTTRDDEQMSDGHNRSNSASSTNSNLSQGTALDASEGTAHADAYISDASGKLAQEPQSPANPSAPLRESNFPSRLDSRRGQTLWRRPSDRFVPRVVSSPTIEMRPELLVVETQVKRLVEDLKTGSLDAQRSATGELRLLAKHTMENRIVIANCGAISLLVDLLRSSDSTIQENAVTALLNLSINDINKSTIANAGAIEPLIYVLETGSPEAKENSAATLFSLSVIKEIKIQIGRSGAIKPLVDLLGKGTPRGKKDAATALFNLSIEHENKARIVQAGAVKYLVELMDPAFGMVDKSVAVLSNLATIQDGRLVIGQEGGIPILVEVVELGSERGKEDAAAALLQLCNTSSRFCNMVLREGVIPPLVALSQSGTPRGREKSQQLLNYFRSQRQGNTGRG